MTFYYIAKTESELDDIFSLRYKVFYEENNFLKGNDNKKYFDAWDKHSVNFYAKQDNVIVGAGRLILSNKDLEFRVSSSLNLLEYFKSIDNVAEISGLAVDANFRNDNIGNTIHYFRIKYAQLINVEYIIASVFLETSVYLIEMGFVVLCNQFEYKHYKSEKKSMLLMLDLKSESTLKKMEDYFEKKIKFNKEFIQSKLINTSPQDPLDLTLPSTSS